VQSFQETYNFFKEKLESTVKLKTHNSKGSARYDLLFQSRGKIIYTCE